MRTLPHAAYIEAVIAALTEAELAPTEHWMDDGETKGVYRHLNAVISLDPSKTYDLDDEDVPSGTPWRHGLILSWEWHTGAEDGWPDKGPLWEFAALKSDGSCQYPPVTLPVHGYASPAAIVEAARAVIDHRIKARPGGMSDWDGGIIGNSWDRADELDAACEAWGAKETA
ncbi:hypothetical protein [Streptomyces sp. NPDC057877]|uniref:hypothetical protein n=1 Tax=Streptomyces sp. NPDC057877 TaxID=3346269 RepID=UPI0036B110E4